MILPPWFPCLLDFGIYLKYIPGTHLELRLCFGHCYFIIIARYMCIHKDIDIRSFAEELSTVNWGPRVKLLEPEDLKCTLLILNICLILWFSPVKNEGFSKSCTLINAKQLPHFPHFCLVSPYFLSDDNIHVKYFQGGVSHFT